MSTSTLNLPEQYNVSEVLFHNLDGLRGGSIWIISGLLWQKRGLYGISGKLPTPP